MKNREKLPLEIDFNETENVESPPPEFTNLRDLVNYELAFAAASVKPATDACDVVQFISYQSMLCVLTSDENSLHSKYKGGLAGGIVRSGSINVEVLSVNENKITRDKLHYFQKQIGQKVDELRASKRNSYDFEISDPDLEVRIHGYNFDTSDTEVN